MSQYAITKKQLKLLQIISDYRYEYGDRPPLSYLVRECELASNRSVVDMIRSLVDKGYLIPADKVSKSTRLTAKALKICPPPNSRILFTLPGQMRFESGGTS